MSLEVLSAAPLITIQDLGRFGYQRFGVPASGAMDVFALRAANELVGNKQNDAGIEIGLSDASFVANDPCLIAVTGTGFELRVNGRPMNLWTAIYVRKGWEIKIQKPETRFLTHSASLGSAKQESGFLLGAWAYLGISGGVTVKEVLGSRSTYLRGRFGGFEGRALQAGDVIPIGTSSLDVKRAGRYLPQDKRPRYDEKMIEVILGPQDNHFSEETIQTFLTSDYDITPASDRMGYRLNGSTLTHRGSPDIISDGIVLGAIQIPANGQPILMMSDHATTGGYPKIATVVNADIPVVAQRLSVETLAVETLHVTSLRFRQTTIEVAQERYRIMMRNLKRIVEPEENFYFA